MKFIKTVLFFFFLIFSIYVQAASEARKIIDEILAPSGSNFDLSKITPQNKNGIVNELKIIVKTEDGDYIGSRLLLLRLGDSQTIGELTAQFREYKERAAWTEVPFYVERAKQPLLVAEFAKDIYSPLNEGFQGMVGNPKKGVVTMVPPKPLMAGVLILYTIRGSNEFSPELKAWAEEMYRHHFDPNFVSKMQRWWEQNKESFETKSYHAVKPLAEEKK